MLFYVPECSCTYWITENHINWRCEICRAVCQKPLQNLSKPQQMFLFLCIQFLIADVLLRNILWRGKKNLYKGTFHSIPITNLEQFQLKWLKYPIYPNVSFRAVLTLSVLSQWDSPATWAVALGLSNRFPSHCLSGQFSGPAQLKDKSIAVCSLEIIMKSAVKLLSPAAPVGNLMATCQLFHPVKHRQRVSDGLLYSNQSTWRQMLKSQKEKV